MMARGSVGSSPEGTKRGHSEGRRREGKEGGWGVEKKTVLPAQQAV